MRINIFEGARRIALLMSFLAVLVVLWLTFTYDAYITRHYTVASPGAPYVSVEECGSSDAIAYGSSSAATPKGTDVNVRFCLPSTPDQLGSRLIAVGHGGRFGNERVTYQYSEEAEAYKKDLAARFQIPPADAAEIDEQAATMKWEQWKTSLTGLAVGLAIFWALVWSIGWIVRGFAGIPRGHDSKPKSEVP